jgi:amino-acid N-acetyltransferase
LNIRLVVHGAAEQIAALAAKHNVQVSNLDGTGVTDAPTLQLAIEAANRVTHEILGGLSANDLGTATTNAIVTHPLGIIHGVDHLFTGKVERVDTSLLEPLLNQSMVPVVSPIDFSTDGKAYRANADSVALAVAIALNAAKLIFITTEDGLQYNNQLIRHMVVTDLEKLLQPGSAGFRPKIASKARHAAAACASGVPRVHIVNGRVDEALLAEVFSNEASGR